MSNGDGPAEAGVRGPSDAGGDGPSRGGHYVLMAVLLLGGMIVAWWLSRPGSEVEGTRARFAELQRQVDIARRDQSGRH